MVAEKDKYYLFVDECGDQNLTSLDENFPIFTLCGVLMSHSQLRAMVGKISALKKKYWGDKTVILHSRDVQIEENLEFFVALTDITRMQDNSLISPVLFLQG